MSFHEIAPDSIDALIAKRLPAWLQTAAVDRLQALHRALKAQQKSAEKMRELLAPVSALDAFAEPLLRQALHQQFKLDVDVRNSTVKIVQEIYHPVPLNSAPKLWDRRTSSRELLTAALHNYTEDETTPGELTVATVLDADKKRLNIGFTQFAKLCRSLDLGGQYQTLLRAHLRPSDLLEKEAVHAQVKEDLRARMEVAVRRAILEGHIDERAYLQLLPLCAPAPIVPGDPAVLTCRQLHLLGKRVEGVVTVEVREHALGAVTGILSWIPGDPIQPVQHHASWSALYQTLARRMRQSPYVDFFMRFVRERDRPVFATVLKKLLKETDSSRDIELDGRHLDFEGTLIAYLGKLRIEKILDDARVLAVPTAEADADACRERFDRYLEAGLTLLNLAAFFVPVLGEVMLGVAAVQIANEVYEGYEDWAIGDRQSALQHMFGVAENLAVAAILATGGMATGKVLERSLAVDNLVPIVDDAGQAKLFRSSMEPHEWSGSGLLMRRLGRELSNMTDEQALWLAEGTGFGEEHLRRLHVQQASPPARLLDAWERYQLHEQFPALRGEAFEAEVRSRQGTETPEALLLRRDFPGLSHRGAREIIEQANGRQLAEMLDKQRIPLELAEHAHWFLRDSRLDRACAGLRQASAVNLDSERLALGLIDQQAPWAENLRLELRDGSHAGTLRTQVGSEEAADIRYIVRGTQGYQARDGNGIPLPQATEQDSLIQAICLHLQPSQKLLLGDASLDEKALTDKLAALAATQREQVATLIRQAPVGEGIRPLARFADGRLGYPLCGRTPGGRQASRRGIHQIYPTLGEDELENYLLDLVSRHVDPWVHYNQLKHQLSRLREGLQSWCSAGGGILAKLRRRRVATAMRRCWRRKSRVLGDGGHWLMVRGEQVGSLPSLPAGISYGHVTRLTLRDMDLANVDADFLSRFTGLVELDLRENRLTQVPAGIERLTSLRYLRLGYNQIAMDSVGNQRLLALVNLRELDLGHNPLGWAPDVNGLRHLRRLSLHSGEIARLPERVQQLPWQGVVDLRNNSIQHVRQDLHNLQLRLQRMVLHDNPLDEASQALVNLASREPINRNPIEHQLIDQAARELWLAGSSGKLRSQREAQWLRLREEPESTALFQFFADFARTEDFREHDDFYRRRIWRMIEACEQNTELRAVMFAQAGGERACEDRLLLILSELEVTLYVERASAGTRLVEREEALLKAGRALYRLDEVNTLAARKVQELERRGGEVDPIEVYMAYRTHLAEPLGLPAQPDGMYYLMDARVSPGDLITARLQVLREETPQRLSEALAQRPFWDSFVHVRYPERVDALVSALDEQLTQAASLSEQMYLVRSEALRVKYEASLQALRLSLAQEAYARLLPAVPVAEA
ncbi:NEL-type E3 ubiquitin ligase domain-containing protein [Mitsuaria sp. RG]|nr:NEL-type E3 ubiquitin ligase domain-containing protein [Mitsuaria sp. RG]